MQSETEPIRFDTKISVLLRDDLQPWQQLNVCAFLISGITAANPELVGEPYMDADGTNYLALLGRPVLVLAGSKELLTAAHARALSRELPISIFTSDMFSTGNDRTTGPPSGPSPGIRWTWSGWPCTVRRTPWTRSSKGRRCTREPCWFTLTSSSGRCAR